MDEPEGEPQEEEPPLPLPKPPPARLMPSTSLAQHVQPPAQHVQPQASGPARPASAQHVSSGPARPLFGPPPPQPAERLEGLSSPSASGSESEPGPTTYEDYGPLEHRCVHCPKKGGKCEFDTMRKRPSDSMERKLAARAEQRAVLASMGASSSSSSSMGASSAKAGAKAKEEYKFKSKKMKRE